MRTVLIAGLCAIAMLAAGCVSLPAAENDPFYSSGTELRSRDLPGDERMSAREVVRESNETCRDRSGDVCVERSIDVSGVFALDALDVTLKTFNGPITLTAGDEGEWRLLVVLRAKGDTVEEARERIDDIRFTWSHTSGGDHFVRAEASKSGGSRHGEGASMALALPPSVLVDAALSTSNGPVSADGVRASNLAARSTNGPITLEVAASNVAADTTNGPIVATIDPLGSGSLAFETTNGPVALELVEDARHGYDLSAKTTNGFVSIDLRDGQTRGDTPQAKTFRTDGYDSRDVRSAVRIESTNGPVSVSPA